MEVKEFQKKIVEFLEAWDRKRKTTATEQLAFTHLVEEVGELAREYVSKELRPEYYKEEGVEDAIGDIFMQLIKIAHLRGLDIEAVVEKILEKEWPEIKKFYQRK